MNGQGTEEKRYESSKGRRRMSDDSQQTNHDRFDNADAFLPGLGIFAGFMIGAVLAEFVMEDWLTVGPVGFWSPKAASLRFAY